MIKLLKSKLMSDLLYKDLVSKLYKEKFDEDGILKAIETSEIELNVIDEHGRTLLFGLVKKRKIEAIDFLLKRGININEEDMFGKTILSEALNNHFMLSFLIARGANIDHINSSKRTLIQDMAFDGNYKAFRFLLNKQPNLTHKDSYQRNILFDAIEGEKIEIVRDVLNELSKEDINSIDTDGRTALFYAVLKENIEITKLLIEYGIDVNIVDIKGQNALFNATVLGVANLEILYLLVERGINLKQKDKKGLNVLDELIKLLKMTKEPTENLQHKYRLVNKNRDYAKFINELFKCDAKRCRTYANNTTLLEEFVLKMGFNDIKYLANNGVDFNVVNTKGQNVLFPLIFLGLDSLKVLKFLFKEGVNINQVDNKESTILDYLVEIILVQKSGKVPKGKEFENLQESENYFELLKNFFALRPKLDQLKSNGQTTIFEVVKHSNDKLLKLFVENRAALNIADIHRETPISTLINKITSSKNSHKRYHFLEKLNYLLGFKINCDIVDKNGRTILHKAVIEDDYDVVERLINSKKASINIKDNDGRTPIQYVQWSGNEKIAEALMSAGGSINEVDDSGYTMFNYALILGHKNLVKFLILQDALLFSVSRKDPTATKFFLENEPKMLNLLKENFGSVSIKQKVESSIATLQKEINKK